jgi:hypothetical protein
MKLYTWQDMCDFEFLLKKKMTISEEIMRIKRGHYYGGSSFNTGFIGDEKIALKLDCAFMKAIDDVIQTLGMDVSDDKANELGFREVR